EASLTAGVAELVVGGQNHQDFHNALLLLDRFLRAERDHPRHVAALRPAPPKDSTPYDTAGDRCTAGFQCALRLLRVLAVRNFSGRATRRNISEQLHFWESNHTAHARLDALLENCVFYISRIYEFLHSQGRP